MALAPGTSSLITRVMCPEHEDVQKIAFFYFKTQVNQKSSPLLGKQQTVTK